MNIPRLAVFLCIWATLVSSLHADEIDVTISADMQRLGQALKTKDLILPIDIMYTPVAEAEGGRDALKKTVPGAKEAIDRQGMVITSFVTVPPFRHLGTRVNEYVIIPVRVVTQVNLHHVESQSFELAIRPHGTKKWEYLNGATITPALKSRFFPDLKDTMLPTVKNKSLD